VQLFSQLTPLSFPNVYSMRYVFFSLVSATVTARESCRCLELVVKSLFDVFADDLPSLQSMIKFSLSHSLTHTHTHSLSLSVCLSSLSLLSLFSLSSLSLSHTHTRRCCCRTTRRSCSRGRSSCLLKFMCSHMSLNRH
jgi:CRP-like cAMP-binding protein